MGTKWKNMKNSIRAFWLAHSGADSDRSFGAARLGAVSAAGFQLSSDEHSHRLELWAGDESDRGGGTFPVVCLPFAKALCGMGNT